MALLRLLFLNSILSSHKREKFRIAMRRSCSSTNVCFPIVKQTSLEFLLELFNLHRKTNDDVGLRWWWRISRFSSRKKNMCTVASSKQKSPTKQCLLIIFLSKLTQFLCISVWVKKVASQDIFRPCLWDTNRRLRTNLSSHRHWKKRKSYCWLQSFIASTPTRE